MPFYAIEAVAYDKDGRRLNGNTHNIEADNQRDAIEIAKSRQKSQVGTVRVETKILRVSDRK
ncbi:hypothetical protein [Limnohabitans planktonicus]|uniref:hypothetical protein n=1 Tax=Limnohabitans planktonicus TaxID=540060 RepID=UPI001057B112|nr:hypothetical protein [Limnohabitans planktonicus]